MIVAADWIRLGALGIALLAMGCAPMAASSGGAGGGTASTTAVSGAVTATIPIGQWGTGVAITPDGSRAFVTASGAIYVIDTSTNQVTSTLNVGGVPYAIAMAPSGNHAVAVDLQQNQIWIIDTVANKVAQQSFIGRVQAPVLRPGVAVSRDGSQALVSTSGRVGQQNDKLWSVPLSGSGGRTYSLLPLHPGQLAVSNDPTLVYTAGCVGICSNGTFAVFRGGGRTALGQVTLSSIPSGIAVARNGSRAYVALSLDSQLAVIDVSSAKIAAKVPVGAGPLGVTLSPDGSKVYVTGFNDGTLTAVDTRTNAPIAKVAIGQSPRAIAVRPDGRFAYVTHSQAHVSVIDLSRLAP